MKDKKIIKKSPTYTIKLPGGIITIGPGTVPTSKTSVAETSIKDVIAAARKASREGIYDSESDEYGTNSQASPR